MIIFLKNISKVIGNPLVNKLEGERYWQPSEKFLRGYWQLLKRKKFLELLASGYVLDSI
jgi:hypothetical protein